MFKVDIYDAGSHVRIRLHDHPGSLDARCDDECYEYAVERCYKEREQSPREFREAIAWAVVKCIRTRALGHRAFQDLVGTQETLPGL